MTHLLSLTVSWSVLAIVVLTVLAWATLGAEATQPAATPTSPEATKPAQKRQMNGVEVPGLGAAVIWTGAEIMTSDGMHSHFKVDCLEQLTQQQIDAIVAKIERSVTKGD